MKIAGREISIHHPPYLVAEISCNHHGDLGDAIALVKAAKRCGADAVKTQCYTADSITIDIKTPHFIIQNGPLRGRGIYELYNKLHTPPKWHRDLYQVAKDEGITIFSSVFDRAAVDYLEDLGCPVYKIASFEIVDLPLVEYAASTKKPMIISTGMASDKEILEADSICASNDVAYLHCISEYPAQVETARLNRLIQIKQLFDYEREVGLSDHTLGYEVPIAGTALGATIIEKHFKLAGDDSGEESEFSQNPAQFGQLCRTVREVWAGLKTTGGEDRQLRQFRRSIYAVANIKKGEVFNRDNIRVIRPGYGLHPREYNGLLGRKAKRDWRRGEPLS